MRRGLVLVVVFACMQGLQARGGGFLIYEHGAAATGMANARTAMSDDASALYFNPAAVTELEGLQLELGVSGILPYVQYRAAGRPQPPRTYPSYQDGRYIEKPVNDGESSVDAKVRGFTPAHLYASYRVAGTPLAVGFGFNSPFGLGTYWPGDWDGRFIGTETEIQTFFAQPVVALDLGQLLGTREWLRLSLAAGYDLVYGTARLARKTDLRVAEGLSQGALDAPEAELRMFGTATGHGWNAALYAELPGLVSFGLSVRSGVSLAFSGTARFVLNAQARQAAQLLGMQLPEKTTGRVDIDLPTHLNTGVAFHGFENLTLAADVYLAFFQSYDALALRFDCVAAGTCTPAIDAAPVRKDWHESVQLCLGAEWAFAPAWRVRAGAGLVTSPVPQETYDPSLPDGERTLIALGGGYRAGSWKIDMGYLLAWWSNEKQNLVGAGDDINPEGKAAGTYSTVSHVLAISCSAWF